MIAGWVVSRDVKLSRPTFVGDARVRTSGRWTVVTRTVRDHRRGTACRHDLYDGDPWHDDRLVRGGIATLSEVRRTIAEIEGEERETGDPSRAGEART